MFVFFIVRRNIEFKKFLLFFNFLKYKKLKIKNYFRVRYTVEAILIFHEGDLHTGICYSHIE